MCKRPEIVPYGEPQVIEDMEMVYLGPPREDGIYQSYWCDNCDRWAYECPICKEYRCDSDLIHSIMGSFPLACKFCKPNGIKQSVTFGAYMPAADDE